MVNLRHQGLSHDISASLSTMENSSSPTLYLIPQGFHNGVLSSVIIIKIIKMNELFFIRGGRLFSEMLERWLITNNFNTKPGFCNSVFTTPRIWLHFYFWFVCWIPSTISCLEKQFLFFYFLGLTPAQRERLSTQEPGNGTILGCHQDFPGLTLAVSVPKIYP